MYTHQYNYRRRRFGRAKKPFIFARRGCCCYCARYFCFGAGVTILVSYLLFGSLVGHVVQNYDSQVTVLTIRSQPRTDNGHSFFQNKEGNGSQQHDRQRQPVMENTTTTTVVTMGLNEIGDQVQKALTGSLQNLGYQVVHDLQAVGNSLKEQISKTSSSTRDHNSMNDDGDDDQGDVDDTNASNDQNEANANEQGGFQKLLSQVKQSGLQQLQSISNDLRESAQNLEGGLHELGEDLQEFNSQQGIATSERHSSVNLEAEDWNELSDEHLRDHVSTQWTRVRKGKISADRKEEAPIEFYWQMPDPSESDNHLRGGASTTPEQRPPAILFLAHPCHLSVEDWFATFSLPAPEEQAIVAMARQRGAMVVAMSSSNQNSQCWDSHDAPRVAKLLQYLDERQSALFGGGGNRIPILAFGSDSGAVMLTSQLPQALLHKRSAPKSREQEQVEETQKNASTANIPVDGILVENVGARLNPEIPVVYLTQSNEKEQREELVAALQQHTGMTRHIPLPPVILTPTFLQERLPNLVSKEQSRTLFNLIKNEELLENGQRFVHNPRSDPTVQRLVKKFVQKTLQPNDQSDNPPIVDSGDMAKAIEEVLMVVWGQDVTTRDGVDQGLDWLLKLLSIPF